MEGCRIQSGGTTKKGMDAASQTAQWTKSSAGLKTREPNEEGERGKGEIGERREGKRGNEKTFGTMFVERTMKRKKL